MAVFVLRQVGDGFYARIDKGVEAMEEEVAAFRGGSPSECAELLAMLRYILYEWTSEKEYSNGTRDKGRGRVRLAYFLTHRQAFFFGVCVCPRVIVMV